MIERNKIIKDFNTAEFVLVCKVSEYGLLINEESLFMVYRREWQNTDDIDSTFDLLEPKVVDHIVSLREIGNYDNAVVIVAEVPMVKRCEYKEI